MLTPYMLGSLNCFFSDAKILLYHEKNINSYGLTSKECKKVVSYLAPMTENRETHNSRKTHGNPQSVKRGPSCECWWGQISCTYQLSDVIIDPHAFSFNITILTLAWYFLIEILEDVNGLLSFIAFYMRFP